jgi:pullulanase
MDKINVTKSSSSLADRVKMNNLAAAIYMMAEGIPLIHAGEEMLRTKVDNEGNIIHNSYNSPDYINSLKWGDLDDAVYQSARDYYAGLIEFRKNHAALRLTTKTEVNNNITVEYIEDNVVMFKINGHDRIAAEVADEIVIIFNANSSNKSFSIYEKGASQGTWNICVNDKKAGTEVLGTVTDGNVTVAPYSALMLVKGATVDTNSIYNRVAVEETGRITVEYVDQNGNMLDWYSLSGKVGTSYSTQAREFDGYVLSKTATNASGKYTSADIFVKYVYGDSS